jgi:hypothetical protein
MLYLIASELSTLMNKLNETYLEVEVWLGFYFITERNGGIICPSLLLFSRIYFLLYVVSLKRYGIKIKAGEVFFIQYV